jgi:hypothetical protein
VNVLVDRYLVAVLDRLPESQRAEVAAELRASMSDMVEARVDAGEAEDAATRAVLTELGDPAKLARSYDQRPQYLIGPAWFPQYFDLFKAIVPAVSLVLAALTFALALADGESAERAITEALGTAFEMAVQTAFWLTLTFALIERFSSSAPETDEAWSVDSLPQARIGRQIGLGSTIFDAIVPVVFGVVAIIQAQSGVGAFVRGFDDRPWTDMPFFNPDLPVLVVAGFFAVLLLSLVAPIIRYRVGTWTTGMVGLVAIESAAWIGFTAIVAFGWPIINPALGEEIDPGGTWWEKGGDANLLILAVVVISSGIDLWDAWKGYREAQKELAAQSVPA